MKIAYQGIPGSYSESCAMENYPNCETISCKTFDECFEKANKDSSIRSIIPESNKTTGNIGVEYLIFKYRLNIYAEHFFPIQHNLLCLSGAKITDVKEVYSHAQALSQSSSFIKKNNLNENVRADTAGSAKYVSESGDKSKGAIASKLSSKIYNLEILKSNIEDEPGNVTRFFVMGKDSQHPEFLKNKKYITSCIFKLKSIPSALYKALGSFSGYGINLCKLESFSVKNTFDQVNFYIDIEGHIEDPSLQKALEELGFHTQKLDVLGVYEAHSFRFKNK